MYVKTTLSLDAEDVTMLTQLKIGNINWNIVTPLTLLFIQQTLNMAKSLCTNIHNNRCPSARPSQLHCTGEATLF